MIRSRLLPADSPPGFKSIYSSCCIDRRFHRPGSFPSEKATGGGGRRAGYRQGTIDEIWAPLSIGVPGPDSRIFPPPAFICFSIPTGRAAAVGLTCGCPPVLPFKTPGRRRSTWEHKSMAHSSKSHRASHLIFRRWDPIFCSRETTRVVGTPVSKSTGPRSSRT